MLAVSATAAPARAPLLDPIEGFRLLWCTGKRAYTSRQVARRFARVVHDGRDDLGRFHAYQCVFCLRWHVGHGSR